mmetsp:Transcript_3700/g.15366  ORF Transcript_3700/g.15366 Transcript_3700/m.15366 type:complete len:210 (+) Transcript_3700:5537-6166(+)
MALRSDARVAASSESSSAEGVRTAGVMLESRAARTASRGSDASGADTFALLAAAAPLAVPNDAGSRGSSEPAWGRALAPPAAEPVELEVPGRPLTATPAPAPAPAAVTAVAGCTDGTEAGLGPVVVEAGDPSALTLTSLVGGPAQNTDCSSVRCVLGALGAAWESGSEMATVPAGLDGLAPGTRSAGTSRGRDCLRNESVKPSRLSSAR